MRLCDALLVERLLCNYCRLNRLLCNDSRPNRRPLDPASGALEGIDRQMRAQGARKRMVLYREAVAPQRAERFSENASLLAAVGEVGSGRNDLAHLVAGLARLRERRQSAARANLDQYAIVPDLV